MSTALERAEASLGRHLATSRSSFQISVILSMPRLCSAGPNHAHRVLGIASDRFASLYQ